MANDLFWESYTLSSTLQKIGPLPETKDELTSKVLIQLERHPKELDKGIGRLTLWDLDADIIEDSDNDPIAISTVINNFLVERILVDDGSAVEILMYEAFKKMRLDESLFRYMVLRINLST